MRVMFMKDKVVSKIVNNDIKHSISTATCQVTESLDGYYPGKWPVKEINDPNNDMSCKGKQSVKIKLQM